MKPPAISIILFALPVFILLAGMWEKSRIITAPTQSVYSTASTRLIEERRMRVDAMASAHGGGISYRHTFDARNPYSKADFSKSGAQLPAGKFDPQDEFWGLPRTGGHELVAILCSGCHSLEIVMQQKMTPDRWEYTLDWMAQTQGMAELSDAQRSEVLAYLSAHFSG